MSKYYINYNTSAGNEWVAGCLADVQKVADAGASYTQEDIKIIDETGNEVCRRRWWGVAYDKNADTDTVSPIDFGDFGYYGDWQDGYNVIG